jgi:hypothetical protein
MKYLLFILNVRDYGIVTYLVTIYRGFGLVIGFIEHLELVTTGN